MQSRDLNSWMWAEALELLQNAEQLQRSTRATPSG